MSLDAAPVTVRTPVSLELTRGEASTITAPLYRDGGRVPASSAVARLYDRAGTLLTSEPVALPVTAPPAGATGPVSKTAAKRRGADVGGCRFPISSRRRRVNRAAAGG